MRNSLMRFANKICITLALSLLVVCIATFALLGSSGSGQDIVANAALSSDSTTTLSSGLGIQYGSNVLRASTEDFYAEGEYVSHVGYIGSGIMGTGSYTLVTKPEIVAGNTNDYSNMNINTAVFYGILDGDITTNFEYSVNIEIKDQTLSSNVNISLSAYLCADSTESSRVDSTVVEKSFVVPAGTTNYSSTQFIAFDISGAQIIATGAHVKITMSVNAGEHTVTISKPTLDVRAESNQLMINANKGVSFSVSGVNRKTVTIDNVYSVTGAEQLASLYVKKGDVITLSTSLLDTNEGSDPEQVFS
ncbi:MAG: hypothetical protein IKB56_00230, partial [Clostridia bacterium]|nr:hypothetical protein [Clostridia bacterium]